MFTAVGEMAHRAAVLQSEPVRRTLGQYVGVLRESLFAYEDLLLLLEGERKHRRPPSERRLRQVVERVEETARRAAEADNRLIRLMTIEMSPEERERFLDSIGVRPDSA